MSGEITQKLLDTSIYALQLFVELALLFVLISFLVGLLQEWLPEEKTRRYLSARHGRGYLLGALIGAGTPFCSCSTVPLTLGLLKSGAGFGPTMTLLFTSPLVNPIIVTLFWVTFGIELTLLYTGMALSMAIGISWIMDQAGFEQYLKNDLFGRQPSIANIPLSEVTLQGSTQCCSNTESETVVVSLDTGGCCTVKPEAISSKPFFIKTRRLLKDAISQFMSFLPHVIIGVLIGAFAHGFVPAEWLAQYAGKDSLWAIPIAAIVGVPLYVRASTMIPIALTLTAKGMGIGAVIALVIGGAGASLPEMIMLKRMFHWPIIIAFLFSVFGIAITTGYLAHFFF